MEQNKKRKQNSNKKELEKQKKTKTLKEEEDNSDDYEDCISEEENEQQQQFQKPKKNKKRVQFEQDDEDNIHDLKYEDDHYDEFEKEDIVNEQEVLEDMQEEQKHEKPKVFLGTDKDLEEGEELDFDNSAYEMFHRANVDWPCLSVDFLLPHGTQYNNANPGYLKMGNNYPMEVYLTGGSQSGTQENFIYFFKMSNLRKTKYDDDSDYQGSDDDEENDEPLITIESVQIKNNVNRIRSMQHQPIVAYWQDNGDVTIMDARDKFQSLCKQDTQINTHNNFNQIKCSTKTFKNQVEGYALDWSNLKTGYLLSGSCDGKIHLYHPKSDNFSDIVRVSNPFTMHQGSVEDLQWSPKDDTEFASCSVDGTVQITDIRTNDRSKSQIKINAHSVDVNVISWAKQNANLIASGADNGEVKVWDKRYPKNPYTEIDFHKEPITSIHFQPNDESSIAVSSADNRLTIWDFAVENDDNQELEQEIPEQLMFIHQGQKDMKELRYHPIYYELLVSTALDGINVFKPALDSNASSIRSEEKPELDTIPEVNEKDLESYLQKMSIKN